MENHNMRKKTQAAVSAEESIWAEFEGIPTVEELRRSSAPLDLDADPEFVAGYLKARFVEDIYTVMEVQGLNRNQLAKKLGKSRQYVGRVLNENANFTLETLAEIACALEMQVCARMYSKDERMTIAQARSKSSSLPLSGAESCSEQGKQGVSSGKGRKPAGRRKSLDAPVRSVATRA